MAEDGFTCGRKLSIKCKLYTWFHKLCSNIALALMEEQKKASTNEVSEYVREREKQETLKGEWHRTPDNVEKILAILHVVYGDTNTYMVAHHILIQPIGSPRALEIPSFESLVFDEDFLNRCHDDAASFAVQLSYMDKQERLDYLHSKVCNNAADANKQEEAWH
jgi:hypothetical protein